MVSKTVLDSVSEPTNEQIEARKRWVVELRSGKYGQLEGMLRNRRGDRRCCLGVACLPRVTHIRLKLEPDRVSYQDVAHYGPVSRSGFLPPSIMQALGLTSYNPKVYPLEERRAAFPTPVPLSTMNDRGISFEEIAEAIEYSYIKPYEEAA